VSSLVPLRPVASLFCYKRNGSSSELAFSFCVNFFKNPNFKPKLFQVYNIVSIQVLFNKLVVSFLKKFENILFA